MNCPKCSRPMVNKECKDCGLKIGGPVPAAKPMVSARVGKPASKAMTSEIVSGNPPTGGALARKIRAERMAKDPDFAG